MRNLRKKNIVVMDARTIMEGMGGPAAGPLRKTGLIIAGTDDVAVDMVMLAIGGRDGGRDVPHLRACSERGIGVADLGSIEVVGETIESVRLRKKFGISGRGMMSLATFFTGTVMYKVARLMPFLKKKECTQCGDCSKICPAKAIAWEKKQYPETDFNKCISCLCCVECCPQHAIRAKYIGVRGLFLKEPSISLPHAK
jgi:Pyruvate/2-oxoacid:ferredoxin oxidoreductase delta subunit